ncbi:hypothetical protein ABN362_00205 [Providencia alcalifaciens]|uniref:hypothetical protein n=1 Tax=Providencia alcalifaciens TaxID=126385 RepID=UPI0032DB61C5
MNVKSFFLTLSNSSTKISKEYEKNNSDANKKLLLKTVISKVKNVYKKCALDVEIKDKLKINKQINILNDVLNIGPVKSKISGNNIINSMEVKSHSMSDSIALHYDSSDCQLEKTDINNIIFNWEDKKTFKPSSINADFSNSTLSDMRIASSEQTPLIRADFSNATLNNVDIKLPIKSDVNYNFDKAKLNNTRIELDIPSGELSQLNLLALFGDDNHYSNNIFQSVLTINDKKIKNDLLSKLKKSFDSNVRYFDNKHDIKDKFLSSI